jgi:hypothetical protein
MYLTLVLVGLVVVGVVFAVTTTRRRARARGTPHAGTQPESLLADRDDTQTRIEESAARERRSPTDAPIGASSPSSPPASRGPDEREQSDGVFRVSVEQPGPAADEVVDILRRHCHIQGVGGGGYDGRIHGNMQSGTAISQLTYVLDRERPGWAQHVSIRPADDP